MEIIRTGFLKRFSSSVASSGTNKLPFLHHVMSGRGQPETWHWIWGAPNAWVRDITIAGQSCSLWQGGAEASGGRWRRRQSHCQGFPSRCSSFSLPDEGRTSGNIVARWLPCRLRFERNNEFWRSPAPSQLRPLKERSRLCREFKWSNCWPSSRDSRFWLEKKFCQKQAILI